MQKHNDDCINNDCNYCKYEENILKQRARFIRTKEQACDYAIDWQNWASNESLSYSELAEWGEIFTKLGEKFDLTREFKENGII